MCVELIGSVWTYCRGDLVSWRTMAWFGQSMCRLTTWGLLGSVETARAQRHGWAKARAIGREERNRSMLGAAIRDAIQLLGGRDGKRWFCWSRRSYDALKALDARPNNCCTSPAEIGPAIPRTLFSATHDCHQSCCCQEHRDGFWHGQTAVTREAG